MVDTSQIHSVISRAKRRLRLQSALNSATLMSIVAMSAAVVVVFLARYGSIGEALAINLLVGCGGTVVLGALWGASRPLSTNRVATLIDRASGLSNRLATACSFERVLAQKEHSLGAQEETMMRLAIEDAITHVSRAKPKEATPFSMPKDAKAAGLCALASALLAGIAVHAPDTRRLTLAELSPPAARENAQVVANVPDFGTNRSAADVQVFLGSQRPTRAQVLEVHATQVVFQIPQGAPVGKTTVRVQVRERTSNELPFEVLDETDHRANDTEPVVLDPEELDYAKALVADIEEQGEKTGDEQLLKLAKELNSLLKRAKEGSLTKQELLDAVNRAQEEYLSGSERSLEEALADLKKAGKALTKQTTTRPLGKALQKGSLELAQKEFEELAKAMEDGSLTDKQQKELAKAMETAAEAMEKAQAKRDKRQDEGIRKQEERIRKLRKEQQANPNRQDEEEQVRRLKKEERELKRLRRNREERQNDPSKRQLKRLRRNMKQAAQDLRRPPDQNRQRSRRQVSKTMRDMARSTGKVSQDRRRMTNKPKVATQMSDLKDALRRAKRKGQKGAKDRFAQRRARRSRDYQSRTKGGSGQKGAWRPDQGQGPGQGQGQKPGSGAGDTDSYGEGHDPNVLGDPTAKSGNTKDTSLQGRRGKGPSTREVILTAAQKGFASRAYEDVWASYKTAIEESLRSENVPAGYRTYIRRYYHTIRHQRKEP